MKRGQRVHGSLVTRESVLDAYRRIISSAYWEFAKNRELELAKKLNGMRISLLDGVLELSSSYYELDIIRKLKREYCNKGSERDIKRCISAYIRKHRIPDLDLRITGSVAGEKVFRLTFIEVGTTDRYYYKKKAVVKNSPAGIILDVVKGRKTGVINPVEGKLVFDGEMAREYVMVMSRAGKLNLDSFRPRKSTTPRVEFEKIAHFLRPIPDLKRRVAGNVPVYFGYFFSDDVNLYMSFPEIRKLGKVLTESVVSFGERTKSKNIVIEARNMKPVEILVIERLLGVVVNVTDVDGRATVNKTHNSYRVNWVGSVNWKSGSIDRVILVKSRPENIDELYLLVRTARERLKLRRT